MKSAALHGKAWVVFNPVAISSSGFWLRACLDLLDCLGTWVWDYCTLSCLCWNWATKGESTEKSKRDSLNESTDALEAAKSLAQARGAIVAVSGAVHIITDEQTIMGTHNVVPVMQRITATRCSVTTLIAAFGGVDPTAFLKQWLQHCLCLTLPVSCIWRLLKAQPRHVST